LAQRTVFYRSLGGESTNQGVTRHAHGKWLMRPGSNADIGNFIEELVQNWGVLIFLTNKDKIQ
jgi:hypothetical protein